MRYTGFFLTFNFRLPLGARSRLALKKRGVAPLSFLLPTPCSLLPKNLTQFKTTILPIRQVR
ncbi:hypothetical protein BJP36_36660 [Moorena producens JHB]|uniref:Uncharacterized protein n=1 Tax=Moorena producens (strain JHB) TaxID=1454205 RepID=A0A9Q9STZ3_MOOP1|nr:hypothetical protein [Moorena producens]WAN69629.1 hypothetical protein BJP36_36660 [Moorena producens JHB]